jgi:hypothetical protein
VAGLDAIGQPLAADEIVTPDVLAAQLSLRQAAVRAVYILNKTDDELCLQQAKQVSAALLPWLTVATVDGQLVWPRGDEDS